MSFTVLLLLCAMLQILTLSITHYGFLGTVLSSLVYVPLTTYRVANQKKFYSLSRAAFLVTHVSIALAGTTTELQRLNVRAADVIGFLSAINLVLLLDLMLCLDATNCREIINCAIELIADYKMEVDL